MEGCKSLVKLALLPIEEFKKFASDGYAYKNICSKIAPSIFGHEDVKKDCGMSPTLPDGVKLRGDINVLLLGDPSTTKSQFLKFIEKTASIAVYTSGKGSSASGLTTTVIQDNNTRDFYLEGGAMVLADGGVVCIDEFDKMRPEDRVAIHEAMEQKTLSIAKAGITTVLNSRTSVLASTNSSSGRYDDLKIFASYIIKVHASAYATSGETIACKEKIWLKRYLQYCRSECHPRLSDSASTMLQNNYVDSELIGGKKVAQTLRDFTPTCKELGIGIVAYSPLGRGFFSSGAKFVETLAKDDFRKFLPRFQLENLEHNNTTVERVSEMASRKKCTPSRLALAWVHHQGDGVCPIPGTTMVENFNQNIAALSVNNSDYELKGSWSVLVLFSHKGKTHSSFTIEELRFRQMQPATTWTQLNLTPTLLTLFLHVAIYNLLPKKKIEKKCI